MAKTEFPGRRKALLNIILAAYLGMLFYFKYLFFFSASANVALAVLGLDYKFKLMQVVFPVGISFYTFQILNYTINVYREHTPVERHWGRFDLYLSYWPQLIASPTGRSGNLLSKNVFGSPIRFRQGIMYPKN